MSDLRSSMLRLASDLPAGDPIRREILAALSTPSRKAGVVGDRYFNKGTLPLKSLARKGLIEHAKDIMRGMRPFEVENPYDPRLPSVTVTPLDKVKSTSRSRQGVFSVYFDGETDESDDYDLELDFIIGKGEVEWYLDSGY